MKLKVISIVLAITIVFTFCCNGFVVASSAEAFAAMALIGLASLGVGWCISDLAKGAGSDLSNAVNTWCDEYTDVLNSSRCIIVNPNTGYCSPNTDLGYTEDEISVIQNVCDDINSSGIVFNFLADGSLYLNEAQYSALKERVTNNIVRQAANKAILNGGDALSEAGLPTYSFDFVGPMPGFTYPTSTGMVSADISGFHLTQPYIISRTDGNFTSTEAAYAAGADEIRVNGSIGSNNYNVEGYCTVNCTVGGDYVIYNGEIYYHAQRNLGGLQDTRLRFSIMGYPSWYVSASGVKLSDACGNTEKSALVGLYSGIYYTSETDLTDPRPSVTITQSDLTSTYGGNTVYIPCTEAEQAIKEAIAKGIISGDEINFNENGEVVGADGITLEQIAELLNKISEQTDIDLSEFTEYLQRIVNLLNTGNSNTNTINGTISGLQSILQQIREGQLTTADIAAQVKLITDAIGDEYTNTDDFKTAVDGIISSLETISENQVTYTSWAEYMDSVKLIMEETGTDINTMNTVLENMKNKQEEMSDDLSSINSNVGSIANALAGVEEYEYVQTPANYDLFTVTHIGLDEAVSFTYSIPIVNQIKGLFDIILSPEKYSNTAPSFKFYYDSDGDGTNEVYNALDLSFMDQTLTNDNLEDKERFKNPITVREFIQQLIILVCYVGFAIKVLKRLPGLIGGSSDFADDFNTVVKKG